MIATKTNQHRTKEDFRRLGFCPEAVLHHQLVFVASLLVSEAISCEVGRTFGCEINGETAEPPFRDTKGSVKKMLTICCCWRQLASTCTAPSRSLNVIGNPVDKSLAFPRRCCHEQANWRKLWHRDWIEWKRQSRRACGAAATCSRAASGYLELVLVSGSVWRGTESRLKLQGIFIQSGLRILDKDQSRLCQQSNDTITTERKLAATLLRPDCVIHNMSQSELCLHCCCRQRDSSLGLLMH